MQNEHIYRVKNQAKQNETIAKRDEMLNANQAYERRFCSLIALFTALKRLILFSDLDRQAKAHLSSLAAIQQKVKVKNISIFKLQHKHNRVTWSGVGGEAYGELK